ncbi:hypothetical protein Btru_029108 [Bulinus truncatus]|nr:hypothetical protein Btru_029108 [Bulinus truncatus]
MHNKLDNLIIRRCIQLLPTQAMVRHYKSIFKRLYRYSFPHPKISGGLSVRGTIYQRIALSLVKQWNYTYWSLLFDYQEGFTCDATSFVQAETATVLTLFDALHKSFVNRSDSCHSLKESVLLIKSILKKCKEEESRPDVWESSSRRSVLLYSRIMHIDVLEAIYRLVCTASSEDEPCDHGPIVNYLLVYLRLKPDWDDIRVCKEVSQAVEAVKMKVSTCEWELSSVISLLLSPMQNMESIICTPPSCNIQYAALCVGNAEVLWHTYEQNITLNKTLSVQNITTASLDDSFLPDYRHSECRKLKFDLACVTNHTIDCQSTIYESISSRLEKVSGIFKQLCPDYLPTQRTCLIEIMPNVSKTTEPSLLLNNSVVNEFNYSLSVSVNITSSREFCECDPAAAINCIIDIHHLAKQPFPDWEGICPLVSESKLCAYNYVAQCDECKRTTVMSIVSKLNRKLEEECVEPPISVCTVTRAMKCIKDLSDYYAKSKFFDINSICMQITLARSCIFGTTLGCDELSIYSAKMQLEQVIKQWKLECNGTEDQLISCLKIFQNKVYSIIEYDNHQQYMDTSTWTQMSSFCEEIKSSWSCVDATLKLQSENVHGKIIRKSLLTLNPAIEQLCKLTEAGKPKSRGCKPVPSCKAGCFKDSCTYCCSNNLCNYLDNGPLEGLCNMTALASCVLSLSSEFIQTNRIQCSSVNATLQCIEKEQANCERGGRKSLVMPFTKLKLSDEMEKCNIQEADQTCDLGPLIATSTYIITNGLQINEEALCKIVNKSKSQVKKAETLCNINKVKEFKETHSALESIIGGLNCTNKDDSILEDNCRPLDAVNCITVLFNMEVMNNNSCLLFNETTKCVRDAVMNCTTACQLIEVKSKFELLKSKYSNICKTDVSIIETDLPMKEIAECFLNDFDNEQVLKAVATNCNNTLISETYELLDRFRMKFLNYFCDIKPISRCFISQAEDCLLSLSTSFGPNSIDESCMRAQEMIECANSYTSNCKYEEVVNFQHSPSVIAISEQILSCTQYSETIKEARCDLLGRIVAQSGCNNSIECSNFNTCRDAEQQAACLIQSTGSCTNESWSTHISEQLSKIAMCRYGQGNATISLVPCSQLPYKCDFNQSKQCLKSIYPINQSIETSDEKLQEVKDCLEKNYCFKPVLELFNENISVYYELLQYISRITPNWDSLESEHLKQILIFPSYVIDALIKEPPVNLSLWNNCWRLYNIFSYIRKIQNINKDNFFPTVNKTVTRLSIALKELCYSGLIEDLELPDSDIVELPHCPVVQIRSDLNLNLARVISGLNTPSYNFPVCRYSVMLQEKFDTEISGRCSPGIIAEAQFTLKVIQILLEDLCLSSEIIHKRCDINMVKECVNNLYKNIQNLGINQTKIGLCQYVNELKSCISMNISQCNNDESKLIFIRLKSVLEKIPGLDIFCTDLLKCAQEFDNIVRRLQNLQPESDISITGYVPSRDNGNTSDNNDANTDLDSDTSDNSQLQETMDNSPFNLNTLCVQATESWECLQNGLKNLPKMKRNILSLIYESIWEIVTKKCYDTRDLTCYYCKNVYSAGECTIKTETCPINKRACMFKQILTGKGLKYIAGCTPVSSCKDKESGNQRTSCCTTSLCNTLNQNSTSVIKEPLLCQLNVATECALNFAIHYTRSDDINCRDATANLGCIKNFGSDCTEGYKMIKASEEIFLYLAKTKCVIDLTSDCNHLSIDALQTILSNGLITQENVPCLEFAINVWNAHRYLNNCNISKLISVNLDKLDLQAEKICGVNPNIQLSQVCPGTCQVGSIISFIADIIKNASNKCLYIAQVPEAYNAYASGCSSIQQKDVVSYIEFTLGNYIEICRNEHPDFSFVLELKEDIYHRMIICQKTFEENVQTAFMDDSPIKVCASIPDFKNCLQNVPSLLENFIIGPTKHCIKNLEATNICSYSDDDRVKRESSINNLTRLAFLCKNILTVHFESAPLEIRKIYCQKISSIVDESESLAQQFSNSLSTFQKTLIRELINNLNSRKKNFCRNGDFEEDKCELNMTSFCRKEFEMISQFAMTEAITLCSQAKFALECTERFSKSCDTAEDRMKAQDIQWKTKMVIKQAVGNICPFLTTFLYCNDTLSDALQACRVDEAKKCMDQADFDFTKSYDQTFCRFLQNNISCVQNAMIGCQADQIKALGWASKAKQGFCNIQDASLNSVCVSTPLCSSKAVIKCFTSDLTNCSSLQKTISCVNDIMERNKQCSESWEIYLARHFLSTYYGKLYQNYTDTCSYSQARACLSYEILRITTVKLLSVDEKNELCDSVAQNTVTNCIKRALARCPGEKMWFLGNHLVWDNLNSKLGICKPQQLCTSTEVYSCVHLLAATLNQTNDSESFCNAQIPYQQCMDSVLLKCKGSEMELPTDALMRLYNESKSKCNDTHPPPAPICPQIPQRNRVCHLGKAVQCGITLNNNLLKGGDSLIWRLWCRDLQSMMYCVATNTTSCPENMDLKDIIDSLDALRSTARNQCPWNSDDLCSEEKFCPVVNAGCDSELERELLRQEKTVCENYQQAVQCVVKNTASCNLAQKSQALAVIKEKLEDFGLPKDLSCENNSFDGCLFSFLSAAMNIYTEGQNKESCLNITTQYKCIASRIANPNNSTYIDLGRKLVAELYKKLNDSHCSVNTTSTVCSHRPPFQKISYLISQLTLNEDFHTTSFCAQSLDLIEEMKYDNCSSGLSEILKKSSDFEQKCTESISCFEAEQKIQMCLKVFSNESCFGKEAALCITKNKPPSCPYNESWIFKKLCDHTVVLVSTGQQKSKNYVSEAGLKTIFSWKLMAGTTYLKILMSAKPVNSNTIPRCLEGSQLNDPIPQIYTEKNPKALENDTTEVKFNIYARQDYKKDGPVSIDVKFTVIPCEKVNGTLLEVNNASFILSLSQIEVDDRDLKKSWCSSINDPHMETFDGVKYNNMGDKSYILYRSTKHPAAVIAHFKSCASYGTCNCGVQICVGNETLTLSDCSTTQFITYETISGAISADQQELRIFYDNDLRTYYIIILRTWTIVKVVRQDIYLNIYILPSAQDFGSTEGLCGTYDGYSANDLLMPDSKVYKVVETDTDNNVLTPTAFNEAWQIFDTSVLSNVYAQGVEISRFSAPVYCYGWTNDPICSFIGHLEKCGTITGEDQTEQFKEMLSQVQSSGGNRRKRQVENKNEDSATNKTHEAGWPTRTGWTLETATLYCLDNLLNKPLEACRDAVLTIDTSLKSIDFDTHVQWCIDDIRLSGGTEWMEGTRQVSSHGCWTEMNYNPKYQNEKQSNDLAMAFLNLTCLPYNCNNHGSCDKGKCICDTGYFGIGCNFTVDQLEPPLLEIPEDNVHKCEISEKSDCSAVYLTGSGFISSSLLSCHIKELVEGITKAAVVNAYILSQDLVRCNLGTKSVMKRLLQISVSNNGRNPDPHYQNFLAYDPICYTCNTINCKKNTDVCFIGTKCVAEGEKSIYNDCEYCDLINPNKWSIYKDVPGCKDDTTQKSENDTSVLPTALIAAGITLLALLIVLTIVLFIYVKRRVAARKQESAFNHRHANQAYQDSPPFYGQPILAVNTKMASGGKPVLNKTVNSTQKEVKHSCNKFVLL